MLLKVKRNKAKAIRVFILFIFLSLISYLLFQLFPFEKSVVSPLAKNSKSETWNLENFLKTNNIYFSLVSKTRDFSYKVDLANGVTVFISPKKDLEFQVASLQQILKQLTIEGKEVKSIDFRFDKPVIAF